MSESTEPAMAPVVVSPAERVHPPGQQTVGMRREQAFVTDDRWVGFVSSDPGEWSGWHHHGQTDTYFYVMRGGIEFEYGADGSTVDVDTGEFCHVPAGLVHRERPKPGERAELVLVRFGPGPAVVNVERPSQRQTTS
jgi:mannose-6-phosphate isomerase-like protein (cupin superfamily)